MDYGVDTLEERHQIDAGAEITFDETETLVPRRSPRSGGARSSGDANDIVAPIDQRRRGSIR